jgi:hypothetical protein
LSKTTHFQAGRDGNKEKHLFYIGPNSVVRYLKSKKYTPLLG